MPYLLPTNGRRALRETLKSLAITSLALPYAMLLLYALVFGVLATFLGLSGTEVMLDFIGSAAVPITLFQIVLLLVFGFIIGLCLFFSSEWLGASIPHLATTLYAKIWESVRLWPWAASGVYSPPHPTNQSGTRFEYWKQSDIWRTPYLAGDSPQLE